MTQFRIASAEGSRQRRRLGRLMMAFSLAALVIMPGCNCSSAGVNDPGDPGAAVGGAAPITAGGRGGTGGESSAAGEGSSASGGSAGSATGGGGGSEAIAGSGGGVGSGGTAGCASVSCANQGKNCGLLLDGCGGTLDCGACAEGAICGLVTANVCTTPAKLCVPLSAETACAGKECGLEGDGCGGTHSCGLCAAEEACGAVAPFQCDTLPVTSDTQCPALIESCTEVGAECGAIGNGCGGTLDCGDCGSGEACGIIAPQLCDPLPACAPLDAATACEGKCGLVSNGCGSEVAGGTIDCALEFPCPAGESCGGGGLGNQCGEGAACAPLDVAAACGARHCGLASDGCGGTHGCGSCGASEVCRSGACEAASCTPQSAALACSGKACGQVGDGCGGVIDCGACASGACGLREPFQCAPAGACVSASASEACAGKECGIVYDGCGTQPANTFDCAVVNGNGACPGGESCGLLEAFQCDAPSAGPCVPDATTCAQLGWACGTAIDSCGGVHDCAAEGRTCGSAETCVGGIRGPTQCVRDIPDAALCPLCASVADCAGQSQLTRLTGRVITPGRNDGNIQNQVGVPNVLVYIPESADSSLLPGISSGFPSGGTSCDRCLDEDLGPVMARAVTNANGDFVLEGNVPVGSQFLLVVKAGKFRRATPLTVPESAACQTTALPVVMPDSPTRLPRTMSDGLAVNIPRMAISTGAVDAMECVLDKMGVASTELTRPGLGGRISLYRANGAWPDQQSHDCNACSGGGPSAATCRTSYCGGSTYTDQQNFVAALSDATLFASVGSLSAHDVVVFDCEGIGWDDTFAQRDAYGSNVREFVNRGGRMFASHFGFTWLHGNGSQAYSALDPIGTGLSGAAVWDTNTYTDMTGTGIVSLVGSRPLASPRIQLFADWLVHHGVTTAPDYTFALTEPRSLASSLGSSTEELVYRLPDSPPQPDPPGHDRRVQQFAFNTPYSAASEASCGRVSYSGFHVASTSGLTAPFQDVVFPAHCRDSMANDGNLTGQEKALLFMLFDLGSCLGSQPPAPVCTPRVCPGGDSCGAVADGCGGVLDCGCAGGSACVDGQCSAPSCVATTCAAENVICASISDGCGDVLECPCPTCSPVSPELACAGVTCGYASDGCGDVYSCSSCPPDCVPLTQCPIGATCGTVSNGCDGTVDCGDCAPGEVCGALEPNVCAGGCAPVSCADLGAACGTIGDGCGGTVDCGDCVYGEVCTNIDGAPNQCRGCEPLDCLDAGAGCGLVGDGCGGVVDCGVCPSNQVCGAVAPNQCGSVGTCTPSNSCSPGADCGFSGDGCGGVIDCGTCPTGETCGINQAFHCDMPPACTPRTCESLGLPCGKASDGCSAVLDCGTCASGAN